MPPPGGPESTPPGSGAPPPPPSGFGGQAAPPPPPGSGPAGLPATPGNFSVGDAFNYGWRKFQENIGPWLLACIVALLVPVLLIVLYIAILIPLAASTTTAVETTSGVVRYTTSTGGGIGLTILTVLFVVGLTLLGWIISAQFIRGALGVTDRGKIELGIFFKKEFLGGVILAAIILAVIQLVLGVIGLVPLIGWLIQFIGSIVVGFFAQFYAYFVLDQHNSAWESIKSSFSFVNQHVASIIVLFLASMVALFIGALLCGIGLFVAIPVTIMAHAYTYRFLRHEPVAA